MVFVALKFSKNKVPKTKKEHKIERGLQKTEKIVYNCDCMITSHKTSKQKQNSRGRGIFMKKSLVLVMALVLVVAFAFAANGERVGLAELSTDKGVVTKGDALAVNFTVKLHNADPELTTIDVIGDEISDNVFVMLIKDLPADDVAYDV